MAAAAAALLLWALLVHKNAAQPWSPVHNLASEYFDAAERQPRYVEVDPDEDIKELFFRRVRAYEGDVGEPPAPAANYFIDIPQPGGFNKYREKITRSRRDVNDTKKTESNFAIVGQIQADLEKHLQRPLYSPDLNDKNSGELQNDTGLEVNLHTKASAESDQDVGVVGINDFIRFRRDAKPEPNPLTKDGKVKDIEDQIETVNINQGDHMGELADLHPFPKSQISTIKQQRTGRMLMQEDNLVPEGSREPRGATKEQWVKQLYPVHPLNVDDNSYDDNIPSPSDVRAPRVHFVTQRRLEPAPQPGNPGNYENSYERQGRARDFNRESSREPPRVAPRIPLRKPDRDDFPEPSSNSKQYDPFPPRFYTPYRDDPYYRYEESRYDPQYGPGPADYDRYRPEFASTNRQRRIIYYATLPEVVRTPPNVNLRNRYSYRDRYDDRYVTSPSLSVAEGNSYRYRKPHPYTKPRYEQEMERTKAPYPLKVSTDVNVRETKKNPERRIYSEPDRRYAYKAPSYQSDESFEHRT